MTGKAIRTLDPVRALAESGDVRVGRIVDVVEGRPLVEFGSGVPGRRVFARVATTVARGVPGERLRGQPVLMVLENGDPSLPIIVGMVTDLWPGAPESAVDRTDGDFEVDGRRITFEGREEVVLRCGQASITLRADGQVIVKGTRLMSRASETNKIRGANVLIN